MQNYKEKRKMSPDEIEQDRNEALPKYKAIKMQTVIDACREPKCEICGRECHGEPHHIKSRGAGGPDIPENLIQLCGFCHRAAHNATIPSERLYRVVARRLKISEEELKRRLDAATGKGGTFDTTELRTIYEEARRDSRRKAVPFS